MNTSSRNRRVLLIDDNPAIHEDFRKILLGQDEAASEYADAKSLLFGDAPTVPDHVVFEVDSAYQGQQGLEMVEHAAAEGRPYALAFVDVRMPPGWDGIETIARLWEKHEGLQVVVCTAYSDYSWDDMRQRFGTSDSLLILKKPFDNVEVLQMAHALTAKWNMALAAEMKIEQLDQAVAQRTRELQRSEERFAKAFQRNPLPMFIEAVRDESVLNANPAFLTLIQRPADALLGHSLAELGVWANESGQSTSALLKRSQRDGGTCILRAASGEQRSVFLISEEFEIGPEKCRLVLLQDETVRLKLEADLRQAQKMEAVGQLAAGVAHDFNNILTVIQGHISLVLLGHALSAHTTRSLKQALTASERAGTLTRQLLAFSRKQVMERKPLKLHTLFEQLEPMLGRLIGDHIQVEMKCSAELPPVLADRCNLEQVLLNLAVNARDAMPHGGRLTIAASEQSDQDPQHPATHDRVLCLWVTDTGTGMDEATKSKIFEPFFTTKEPGKGTGMGLATVYGIVKQHQGWIVVESAVGRGTTFKIYLPISVGFDAPVPQSTTPRKDVNGHETILVVEDESMLLDFVKDVLTSHGYRVVTATNALDAMQLWETQVQTPSLLLTDMVMPGGVTGKQLADKLRQTKPDLRVIYSSGYSLDLLGEQPLAKGQSILQKPYVASLLVKTIRDCLDSECGEPALITRGWSLQEAVA